MFHSAGNSRASGASAAFPSGAPASYQVIRSALSASGSERLLAQRPPSANHGGMMPRPTTRLIIASRDLAVASESSGNGATPPVRWHSTQWRFNRREIRL
jgi:hypothetical protein